MPPRVLRVACGLLFLLSSGMVTVSTGALQAEELFAVKPYHSEGFDGFIEGPACDAAGNLFVVAYRQQSNIGRISPKGVGDVFVQLPNKGTGNGIVFDKAGAMYIAEYTGHNVLKVDPRTKEITVLVHEPKMNQPNDLAIGPDEVLYASDPAWSKSTGQVWRIDSKTGTHSLLAGDLGTTNGIEVSPDGKTLYVNESVQRNIWAFTLTPEGTAVDRRLLRKFEDFGFDGMRADIEGNLYVTRHGKGTVVILSPQGEILKEIDVLGSKPSNLCFGGPDGKTVYVTEVEHTRVVQFRAEKPGLVTRWWK